MADYIIRVFKDSDINPHTVTTYKLTGISSAVSAYAVLADYESNHMPPDCRAEVIIVDSEYPFWDTFYRHAGDLV